ncbi:MAG: hypothetical protein ACPL6D_08740, partial [Thermodesulfobacteriota bacterium]
SSFKLYRIAYIRLPAYVADPLFVDDTNTGSIATQFSLGKVFFLLDRKGMTTPAAEPTIDWNLSPTIGTRRQGQQITTMRAFHLPTPPPQSSAF